ncbi:hypothetical protein NA57DRAFT_81920 [Rhizodiscina lignyota]|uniref:DUF7730 domain-containing protein n=1 Tax=Rhizodiscina lignyota TaxID=1504668 RepID=A0A9P4LZN2_9PEZI|nr:hypothetical protein NA57DRAFT_81920 [Rhizodiscina lignyota]
MKITSQYNPARQELSKTHRAIRSKFSWLPFVQTPWDKETQLTTEAEEFRIAIMLRDRERSCIGPPQSGRRPLSLHASEHASGARKKAHNKTSQSQLLVKLPGEVRNEIYRYSLTLAYDSVTIRVWNGGLVGWFDVDTIAGNDRYTSEWHNKERGVFKHNPGRRAVGRTSILALLLTCRQIYSEAIDFAYSENILIVTQLYALPYLSRYLPQKGLDSIQTLSVDTFSFNYRNQPEDGDRDPPDTSNRTCWLKTCETLRSMRSLKKLDVRLPLKREMRGWTAAYYLMPLEGIQVPNFTVYLHDEFASEFFTSPVFESTIFRSSNSPVQL